MTWRGSAAGRRRGCRCSPAGNAVPTARGKRGKGHRMVPFPPLDSPKPSFEPLSKAFAAKRGRRGLGSVCRADFGTLLCPEVNLRDLPRITVRGQTVQSACFALRTAPLRSRVYPWSSERPCGPLAFRRATGGSRVQRRVWGVKRGKGTIGALSPLVSAARRRQCPVCPSAAILASSGAPLYRRNLSHLVEGKEKGRTAVSAEINPPLRVKENRTHICAEDKSLIL